MLAWAAAVGAALLALCAWLWHSRPRTTAPGPRGYPLIGNVLDFLQVPVLTSQLSEMHRRYGDVFRFYVGPKLFVVVSKGDDVLRVLAGSKMRERDPYFIRTSRLLIGDGLLTNKGEKWKKHRKITENILGSEMLTLYTDSFHSGADFVCSRLAETAGREQDVYVTFFQASMRIITSSILGVEWDDIIPDVKKQKEMAAEIVYGLKLVQRRLFRPWMMINSLLWMTPEGRELKRLATKLSDIVQRTIDFVKENKDMVNGKGKRTILDIMTEPEESSALSPQEITDGIRTIGFAGTDTSSATMSYVLALLALHPEWQHAVHSELDRVFGSGGDYLRNATTADLAQLNLLDSVVKETLRLFPAVPQVPHYAAEDTPLAGGRFVAPRGSCVLVSFSLLHRQPHAFPDPERFDPGRFLDGANVNAEYPGAYLPFGAGSRKCVGARFALLEVKTILSAVLRRFRLLPGSSRLELEQIMLSITSHPVTGVRVTCVPREGTPLAAA